MPKEEFCGKCGKKIDNDEKFCPYCGETLNKKVINDVNDGNELNDISDKFGIDEELRHKEIKRLVEANERGITINTNRLIPLLFFGGFLFVFISFIFEGNRFFRNIDGTSWNSGLFYALSKVDTIAILISFFVALIITLGIFFYLNKRGIFHEGKSDLEPNLNILTDEEILKYTPKSNAASKIKQSGNDE